MSTVDPVAERHRRQEQRRNAPVPPRLVAAACLTAGSAAIAAWLLMEMIVNNLRSDSWVPAAGTIALIVLTGITLVGISRWNDLAAPRPGWLGWSLMIALAFAAAALGFSVAAPSPGWLQAPALNGFSGGAAAIGLAFAIVSVTARWARLREAAFEANVLSTTAPVTAVVTDQGYQDSDDWLATEGRSDVLSTTVTYRFTDHEGTQRWVSRSEFLPAKAPLANGDEFDLWFDRANPSNTRRIIIRPR